MLMWAMSDRAIPRSYRMMQGFGVHTFRLVNAEGESHFVKFHWTPAAGTHSLVWDEAVKISGADPDFHRRDLWEAIEAGAYPEYELGLQIFTEEQAEGFSFDVLDATKIVPEELVPVVAGRQAGARTATPTTSSPRPSRSRSAPRTSCPASTSPTIRCSPGRIHSYVGHADLAARRAELPRDPDQRAGRAGAQQPARRHAPPGDPPRPRRLRAELARRRLSVPGRRGGLRLVPASAVGAGAQGPRQGGAVRRPLHAGHAVLEQPDRRSRRRTSSTPSASSCRASQTPAIRERMVSGLLNVASELAEAVADGPRHRASCRRRCRRCWRHDVTPEVTASPALSLFARPGDGSIRDAARRDPRRRRRATAAPLRALARAAGRRRRGAALRRSRARRASSAMSGDAHRGRASRRGGAVRAVRRAWSCPTAPPASTRSRRRPGARVRQGPVPPLQADPRARRAAPSCCDARGHPGRRCPTGSADPGLVVDAAGDAAATRSSPRSPKHRHFARETDPPRV